MKLIINADDAGIDSSRNRGIFDCLDNGVVKSISVIVYQTGWADIVDRLTDRKNIGAGLHVNLTAGRPLAEGHRTLVNERGFFFDKFELYRRAHQGLIDSKEAVREFLAQLERFKNCGISPTHIDGHNHVHLLPGVREGFKEVFPAGAWVRLPHQRNIAPLDSATVDLKDINDDSERLAAVFNFLSAAAKDIWQDKFRHVDDFTGTMLASHPTLAGFKKAVSELQGGICELMCHPGAQADENSANFSKLKERQEELEILKLDALKKFLSGRKIELISYRELH